MQRLYGALGATLCLIGFLAIQVARIDADNPPTIGMARLDVGAHCDEGYKTLDAKNRVLFGSVRWSDADEYGGAWSALSPVNSWLNHQTFLAFGVRLRAARLVSLVFGGACFVAFLALMRTRFAAAPAFWGSLLLLVHPLFVITARVALLEVKLLFFVVMALLLLPRRAAITLPGLARLLASGACLLAAWFTKQTAVVFIGALGATLFVLSAFRWIPTAAIRRRLLAGLAVALAGSAIVLEGLYWTGRGRFCISARGVAPPSLMLANIPVLDLFLLQPVLPALALLASFRIFDDPRGLRQRPLDFLMAVWLWLTVLIFTAFFYHPERYYALALPPLAWLATVCLVDLRATLEDLVDPRRRALGTLVLAAAILLGLGGVVRALMIHLGLAGLASKLLAWKLGVDHPDHFAAGISGLLSAILALGAALAVRARSARTGSRVREFLPTLAWGGFAISTIVSVAPLVSWAWSPAYELARATEAIRALGHYAVVVGDWAPQLTLDAHVRSIYSKAKPKEQLNLLNMSAIAPTHLVIVEGVNEREREKMDALYPGARAAEPVLRLPYAGRTILVYGFHVSPPTVKTCPPRSTPPPRARSST